jgi:hypothetical protein
MMTMGAIKSYHIDSDLLEGGGSFVQIFCYAERRSDEEAAVGVFDGIGEAGEL